MKLFCVASMNKGGVHLTKDNIYYTVDKNDERIIDDKGHLISVYEGVFCNEKEWRIYRLNLLLNDK